MKNSARPGVFSATRTPHVWHQGRKVTPFAGAGRYPYRRIYGGYRGGWDDPQRMHRRWKEAISRRRGVGTIGQPPKHTTIVECAAGSFRLLDAHGKPHGRRYAKVGPQREVPVRRGVWSWLTRHDLLVIDQRGNQLWLDGRTLVRLVDQQPEDYHSYASRVLTRAHKQEA